jgi:dipeptidyl aminopeptidase/acylaminoacyl peptidase
MHHPLSRRALTTIVLLAALAPWALLPGCRSAANRPRAAVYDARTFYETVTLRGVSLSADGEAVLFSSDVTGVFNAYTLGPRGGEPLALTASTGDAIQALSFFPADRRVLFQRDRGGDELVHLYVRGLDGSVRDLTPGEGLRASFAGWAGDDRSFLVATNERDPRFFDLYRYSVDDYTRRLVYENADGYALGELSPDGRWLLLSRTNSNSDDDLFLFDTLHPAEPPRLLTAAEGAVSHGPATFSADSQEVYYASDRESEYLRLWAVELMGFEHRLLRQAEGDVTSVVCSRDGRRRVLAIDSQARTRIVVEDLVEGVDLPLPDLGDLDVQDFDLSRDGETLACLAWNDTSPADLYLIDLDGERAERLTESLDAAIDQRALVRAEHLEIESYDGLAVPCLLYRPLGASERHRAPALLWMHGGPGGQSRHGYNPLIQHLVNHGIAVLAVNNRGSSGYGKSFFHLDDRRHGEADLDDCVAARRWLAQQPWCDGERVGIMGGSYGGYLVLAALAFRPEEFAVGIDVFGVANWLRTLESIPPWWTSQRAALYDELGDPAVDSERLSRISPLFHAERIRRPLLVVQGANDPRVLQVESDEMVAAVRRSGVPCEYLLFPDEGHGFQHKTNRIAASEAYLSFARRHLFRARTEGTGPR